MRIWFYLILVFFGMLRIQAQPSSIQYSCPGEKEVFEQILSGKHFDTLGLFFFISDSSKEGLNDVRKELENTHQFLMKKRRMRMNSYAYMRNVLGYCEANVLVEFKDYATFPDLMYSRQFNHFTGTFLLAWFMQRRGIKYTIHEYPTYVVAEGFFKSTHETYPVSAQDASYIWFHEEDMRDMVDNMRANGKIPATIGTNESTRELFNQYAYQSEGFGIKELSASIYYRDAVRKQNLGQYDLALHQINKALILYPNERFFLLKRMILWGLIRTEQSKTLTPEDLIRNVLTIKGYNKPDLIISEWSKYMQTRIGKESRVDSADSLMKELRMAGLNDEIVRECCRIYYNELAAYYQSVSLFHMSLRAGMKAFRLYPAEPSQKLIFTSGFLRAMQSLMLNPDSAFFVINQAWDSVFAEPVQSVLPDLLSALNARYANFNRDIDLKSLKSEYMLVQALMKPLFLDKPSSNRLSEIYSFYSSKFFALNDYDLAFHAAQSGLALTPDEEGLKTFAARARRAGGK